MNSILYENNHFFFSRLFYSLQFKNYSDAVRFIEWLLGLKDKDRVMIGKNTLLFNGKPVTSELIGKEEIKVIPVY